MDSPLSIIAAHHHGETGPGWVWREWRFGECSTHSSQCRLRMPLPVREAEGPIFHIRAVVVPLVSPGKNQGASAAGRECGLHLPLENARLAVLAVSKAVQPNLG